MFTAYRPSPPERRPCPARASTARKRVDCVSSKHTETRDATRPRLGAVTAYAVPQPQHRRQLAVRDAWEAAVGSNVARVTLASSTQGATRGSDKGCLGLPKPQPSAQYRPLSGGPSCAARRHASSTLQTAWCARPGRRRPPPKFAPQPFGRQTRICRAPPAPRLAPRPRDTPTAAPLAASAATASGRCPARWRRHRRREPAGGGPPRLEGVPAACLRAWSVVFENLCETSRRRLTPRSQCSVAPPGGR